MREIGGWKGLAENRNNTTVLAVVLEDAVALLGILLTLLVAGVSFVLGPHPVFDAAVAIAVGVLLGAMALFLAAINRRLLIDFADPALGSPRRGIPGRAGSVGRGELDRGRRRSRRRVRPRPRPATGTFQADSIRQALGEALQRHALERGRTTVDDVYWKGL